MKINAFDVIEATKRMKDGMKQVEENHPDYVAVARKFAVRLCKKYGFVTSDMIQKVFPRPKGVHPNCMGAVFNVPYLVDTGVRIMSRRTSAHRREIKVFRFSK